MSNLVKVITVLGARPQFVKSFVVSEALREMGIQETIIHTGQHFDERMSQVFFDELGLRRPAYQLDIHGLGHGAMTGRMLEHVEQILLEQKPSWVLVYGDTNSTLAGALAAAKLNLPIAHVEAGLRSWNRQMPEEINRVLTDHLANLMFCSSQVGKANLHQEGISQGVHVVGDVMLDTVLRFRKVADERIDIVTQLDLQDDSYWVATVHRAETTDVPAKLQAVADGFAQIDATIVMPMHPRTRHRLNDTGISLSKNVKVIEPLSYLEMVQLVSRSAGVLTDSGGLQKEAVWLGRRCVTLREETEWTELVEYGWSTLVGTDPDQIVAAAHQPEPLEEMPADVYGDGDAARRIARELVNLK